MNVDLIPIVDYVELFWHTVVFMLAVYGVVRLGRWGECAKEREDFALMLERVHAEEAATVVPIRRAS